MKLISVENLTKNYSKKIIIDSISLDVNEGEILGILGPNGAGKTTFLKILLGLVKEKLGNVKYCKRANLFEMSDVGSVIEKPSLFLHLSARKNIEIFTNYIGSYDESYVNGLVVDFGLDNELDKKVGKYSLGMKQRLALIIALLNKPKLLLLDEPLNGLDPEGIVFLRNFLIKLNRENNTTIIISSHILSELDKLCHRALVIKKGKLLQEFNMQEIGSDKMYQLLFSSINDRKRAEKLLEKEHNIVKSLEKKVIIRLTESINSIFSLLQLDDIMVEEVSLIEVSLEQKYLDVLNGEYANV